MNVYSGKCRLCSIGNEAGGKDSDGRELHTGDIVQIWHGSHIGTELEEWNPAGGLTVVVSDQYQSYSDGSVTENPNPVAFIMGIKDCGFNSPEWRIVLLKKYSDVVEGEHWPDFGFSYASQDAAMSGKRGGE